MIICRDLNEEKQLDRIWYESSSILYSECDDAPNSLKTLRVTFKNGSTYQYSNVDVNDYVMFVHGGLDGSNGKALNKFIKPKCEYERLSDIDINDINAWKDNVLERQRENTKKEEI